MILTRKLFFFKSSVVDFGRLVNIASVLESQRIHSTFKSV